MERMTHQQAEREAQRMQAKREELVERIARAIRDDGTAQPLQGLHLYRFSAPPEPVYSVSEPSLCVIAQGSKEVLLGDSRYRYDPSHYLLATVDLPASARSWKPRRSGPTSVCAWNSPPPSSARSWLRPVTPRRADHADVRAIDVSPLDGHLLDALVRLVRLLDAPAEARVLLPLITREIIYRLLMGEQGGRLRHLAILGGYTPHIARRSSDSVKTSTSHLRIERSAHELGMSVSGFHHHFKAVTAMSPLQFQKQLRLQEARRLMLGEDLDAASAGLSRGLPRRLPLQSGVQKPLRRPTDARRTTPAGRRQGECRCLSRVG